MTANLIDSNEVMISLGEAAKSVPGAKGRHVASTTLWRWAHHGVRLPSGDVIHLEFAKIGSRVMTSREAVRRFLSATDAAAKAGIAQSTH